jgi:hypothetical protein
LSRVKSKLSQTRIKELIALDLAASLESIRSTAPTPVTWLEAIEIYAERNPLADPDEIGLMVRLDEELFRKIEAEARAAKLIKDNLAEPPAPLLLRCHHCGQFVPPITFGRWHGENCVKHPEFGEANTAKRKAHLASMRACRKQAREAFVQASIESRHPGSPEPPKPPKRPSPVPQVPPPPKPAPVPPNEGRNFKIQLWCGTGLRRQSRDLLTID